jgi:hypothetical protein
MKMVTAGRSLDVGNCSYPWAGSFEMALTAFISTSSVASPTDICISYDHTTGPVDKIKVKQELNAFLRQQRRKRK